MKSRKMLGVGFVMAVVLLLWVGIIPASAYDVTIKNMTAETVNVGLYTRSDYPWDQYSQGFGPNQSLTPNMSYTYSVSSDSRHMCPSYVVGYNADYSKSIVTMGCDGMEGNMLSRCCASLFFHVHKKTNGLHFEKN